MLSKMSGKCHVHLETVWKISHASEKCPEYCNIPDRQYSGKRPEYCNIPDIFWTQTISGRLFFIGYTIDETIEKPMKISCIKSFIKAFQQNFLNLRKTHTSTVNARLKT